VSEPEPIDPPLNVRETAAQLGSSEDITRDLLRKRKIAGFKVGGQWRVPRDAVTEYIIRQLAKS
jgi:excisionase family DNA binding protein